MHGSSRVPAGERFPIGSQRTFQSVIELCRVVNVFRRVPERHEEIPQVLVVVRIGHALPAVPEGVGAGLRMIWKITTPITRCPEPGYGMRGQPLDGNRGERGKGVGRSDLARPTSSFSFSIELESGSEPQANPGRGFHPDSPGVQPKVPPVTSPALQHLVDLKQSVGAFLTAALPKRNLP